MITFKEFCENKSSEEERNIRDTMDKLPSSHQKLVKGFSFEFQPGNTLKGDTDHIGYLDKGPKEIAVAAPWNYGREFTFLHEIAHRVWEKLDKHWHDQWAKIAGPRAEKEGIQELFCMAYAAAYCQNPPVKYYDKNWMQFIKQLPS